MNEWTLLFLRFVSLHCQWPTDFCLLPIAYAIYIFFSNWVSTTITHCLTVASSGGGGGRVANAKKKWANVTYRMAIAAKEYRVTSQSCLCKRVFSFIFSCFCSCFVFVCHNLYLHQFNTLTAQISLVHYFHFCPAFLWLNESCGFFDSSTIFFQSMQNIEVSALQCAFFSIMQQKWK